ncbi:hypothetical protein JCM10213v2_007944 [Rhodosporidiobolus nylandii]
MSFLSRLTRKSTSTSSTSPSAPVSSSSSSKPSKTKPPAAPSAAAKPALDLSLPSTTLLSDTAHAAPLLLRTPASPSDPERSSLRSVETTPWVDLSFAAGGESPKTARTQLPAQRKGLTTLGLFRPFRLAESPAGQLKLISLFLDYCAELENISKGSSSEASRTVLLHAWREEVRYALVEDAVGVLKWALRHFTPPPSATSSSSPLASYTSFLPHALSSNAFSAHLLPSLPPPSQRLLLATLEVVQHVTAFSELNAMSARRLCRSLGLFVFFGGEGAAGAGEGQGEGEGAWEDLYRRWQLSGEALEGCLKAYLRDQDGLPPRLQDLVVDYDEFIARQTLLFSSPSPSRAEVMGGKGGSRQVPVLRIDLETRGEGWKLAGDAEVNDQLTGLALPPSAAAKAQKRPMRRRPVEILLAAFSAAPGEGGGEGEAQRAWEELKKLAKEGEGGEGGALALLDEETGRVLRLLGLDRPSSSSSPATRAEEGGQQHSLRRRSVDVSPSSSASGSALSRSPYGSVAGAKSAGNLLGILSPNGGGSGGGKRIVTPSWNDFATTGFSSSSTFLALDSANELGLLSPSSAAASTRPALPAARAVPPPQTRIVRVTLTTIDEEFADVWLETLAESRSALSPVAGWPGLLVAPLRRGALDEQAQGQVEQLLIHERLLPPFSSSAPTATAGLDRALSSASTVKARPSGRRGASETSTGSKTKNSGGDEALSPRKKWRRRASAIFSSSSSTSSSANASEGFSTLLPSGRRSRKSFSGAEMPPPVPLLPTLPPLPASPPPAPRPSLPQEKEENGPHRAGLLKELGRRASRVSLTGGGGGAMRSPKTSAEAPASPPVPERFLEPVPGSPETGRKSLSGYEVSPVLPPAREFEAPAPASAPVEEGESATKGREREQGQEQEKEQIVEPLSETVALEPAPLSAGGGDETQVTEVGTDNDVLKVEPEAAEESVPSPPPIDSPIQPPTPLPPTSLEDSACFPLPILGASTALSSSAIDLPPPIPEIVHHAPQEATAEEAKFVAEPVPEHEHDEVAPSFRPDLQADGEDDGMVEFVEDVAADRAPLVDGEEESEPRPSAVERAGENKVEDNPTFTLSPPPAERQRNGDEEEPEHRFSEETVTPVQEVQEIAEPESEPVVEELQPEAEVEASVPIVGLGLVDAPAPPAELPVSSPPPATPTKSAPSPSAASPHTPASPSLAAHDASLSRSLSQESAPKSPTPSNTSTGSASRKFLSNVGGFLRRKKSTLSPAEKAQKAADERRAQEELEQKQLRKLREEELRREIRERKIPTPVSNVKARVKEIEQEHAEASSPVGQAISPSRSARPLSMYGAPASPSPMSSGLPRDVSLASIRPRSRSPANKEEPVKQDPKPVEQETRLAEHEFEAVQLASDGPFEQEAQQSAPVIEEVAPSPAAETASPVKASPQVDGPTSTAGADNELLHSEQPAQVDARSASEGVPVSEAPPPAEPSEGAALAEEQTDAGGAQPSAQAPEPLSQTPVVEVVPPLEEPAFPAERDALEPVEEDVTGPLPPVEPDTPAQEKEHLQVKLPSAFEDLPSPIPSPTPQPDSPADLTLLAETEDDATAPLPDIQPPVFVVEPAAQNGENGEIEPEPLRSGETTIEEDHTGPIPSISLSSPPPAPAQESEHLHVKVPSPLDDLPSPMPSPTPLLGEDEPEPLAEDLTETLPEIRQPVFESSEKEQLGGSVEDDTTSGEAVFAASEQASPVREGTAAEPAPAPAPSSETSLEQQEDQSLAHKAGLASSSAEPQDDHELGVTGSNTADAVPTPMEEHNPVSEFSHPADLSTSNTHADFPATPTKPSPRPIVDSTPVSQGARATPVAALHDDVFSAPSPSPSPSAASFVGVDSTPTKPAQPRFEHVIHASPSQYSLSSATSAATFATADSSAQSSANEHWEAPQESF